MIKVRNKICRFRKYSEIAYGYRNFRINFGYPTAMPSAYFKFQLRSCAVTYISHASRTRERYFSSHFI